MVMTMRFFIGAILIVQVVFEASAQGGPVREPVAVVELDGKWGFINRKGEFVFDRKFDRASHFSEGLAAVKIGGKWGYIDTTGNVAIPPGFDDARDFSEGLACATASGKTSIIDTSGKTVFHLDACPDYFSEGLAAIQVNGLFGYIDTRGTMVVNPQFQLASSFADGRAHAKIGGRTVFIDRPGIVIINIPFDHAKLPSEGMIAVEVGEKYGYANSNFDMVIPPQFSDAMLFTEGVAFVTIGPRYFFIDKTGKEVIGIRSSHHIGCEGYEFSEGLIAAWIDEDEKCGFIDLTGRVAIRTDWDTHSEVGSFCEGMASFKVYHSAESVLDKGGYIAKDGKIAIPPRFDSVSDFRMPDIPHGKIRRACSHPDY